MMQGFCKSAAVVVFKSAGDTAETHNALNTAIQLLTAALPGSSRRSRPASFASVSVSTSSIPHE